MDKLIFRIMLISILISGCSDDDNNTVQETNQNPESFTVQATEITNNSSFLIWNSASDPDGDSVTYNVFLDENQVASQLTTTQFLLEDLSEQTSYTGKVIASDGNEGTSESSFSFTTTGSSNEIGIAWERSLGGSRIDIAYSIQLTNDGGYIVAGTSPSDDGDVGGNNDADGYIGGDIWIVKLNSSGEITWETNLGGSLDEEGNSIQQTTDGGYIVAGTTNSPEFDPSGNFDFWVVKLDASGNIVWENTYGGSGNDSANSIQQTTDGGYVVAGFTTSSDNDVSENNGALDYWIIKIDSSGTLEWETNLGGSEADIANAIMQTNDGGYIVGGYSESSDFDVTGNYGDRDYWIVKLDSFGNFVWGENFGGTLEDTANDIQQTSDNGYIVAGFSESSDNDVSDNNGNKDIWIIKLNSSGQLIWENNLGSSESDNAQSIQQTTDQGYILAGNSGASDFDASTNNGGFADYWVVKLTSSGEMSWELSIGGPEGDFANSIQQTNDGYIVTGYVRGPGGDISGMGKGQWDYWVVKLE